MNNDQITNLLSILLVCMVSILFVLVFIFVWLKIKEKNKGLGKNKKQLNISENGKEAINAGKGYNKQSIFKFMEFESIEDNMIIQKKGNLNKYLMVVECQGINYDLMSGIEKNSVEQGFLQFLNTLRHPIQIYVQTKTVNLTESLKTYNEKIKELSNALVKTQMEYNDKVSSGNFTPEQLNSLRFEIIKQRNLYEYGIDVVKNTEQMSLNRNILTKKYYIIIPYYPEDISEDFVKEEIKNLAFSELYTKAQSIINALAVCGIHSKVLNSNQLVELLYVAYNRDESEVYGLDKALKARYDELYVTAEDVLDKRMREINKKIEEEAQIKANEVVFNLAEERAKEREIKERERKMSELINKTAMRVIDENKEIIGDELAEKAKEKLEKKSKSKVNKREGGKEENEKEQKARSRKTI